MRLLGGIWGIPKEECGYPYAGGRLSLCGVKAIPMRDRGGCTTRGRLWVCGIRVSPCPDIGASGYFCNAILPAPAHRGVSPTISTSMPEVTPAYPVTSRVSSRAIPTTISRLKGYNPAPSRGVWGMLLPNLPGLIEYNSQPLRAGLSAIKGRVKRL